MIVEVAELFAALGSVVGLETLAVFVTVPSAVAFTTTVAVADAPFARVPTAHVMVPPTSVQVTPALPVADTNDTLPGTASVTVTAAADEGPLLVTVTV